MITIYHNPSCGISRNTLGLIRNSGVEPTIVEYLKTPASRPKLVELTAAMHISARNPLRRKATPYEELRLNEPKWSDAELINFMVAHPILIDRPIVVTSLGTALCRASEAVLDLLPSPQRGGLEQKRAHSSLTRTAGASQARPDRAVLADIFTKRPQGGLHSVRPARRPIAVQA